MDARLLFPSLYIGAADLRGKDVTLTIDRVQVDDLKTDKGTEKKPVIYFREMVERSRKSGRDQDNKRLVMNKTNAKAIWLRLGHEMDNWPGQRVTLYATTCMAFGRMVDCIRVREQEPAAPKGTKRREPEPPPPEADEEPIDDFADDEAAAEE